MRNPKWSKDEVILLVDLYGQLMNQNKDLADCPLQLQELSDLLRNHAIYNGHFVSDTFRNVTGLKMKCSNITSIVEGSGLSHSSLLDRSVVEMLLSNPAELHKKAEYIRREWSDKIHHTTC